MATPIDTSDLTATPPSTPAAPDMSDLTATPPSASSGASTTAPEAPAPERGFMENIVGGFMKGASETAQGAANLVGEGVEKLTGMPAGSLQATRTETERPSVARDIGEGAENVDEFAVGDAALEGAAKMAKIAKNYPEVIALMEKYPKASKILLGSAKAAAVGGAQGAAKGAADEQALKGAEGGAAGGAVGGAAAETAGEIASEVGKRFGIGTTAISDATRGAKPNKRNVQFAEAFHRAAPYLDAENQLDPAKTVEDWADHADNARKKLWAQQIQPIIDQHANQTLNGMNIENSIVKNIPAAMRQFSPSEAVTMENLAKKFGSGQNLIINIGDAEEALEHFNAQLASTGYWSKLPNERAALLRTNGEVAGYKAAADAIRDELYNRLSTLQPADAPKIEELKKEYGALRNVGNEIRGQVNVAGRQAPISLKETIGMATGIGRGGLGGAVMAALPFVDRAVNSPESLIERGVQKAVRPGEEGVVSKAVQGAGKGAKSLVAPTASGVGRIVFQASDNSMHSVPADQIHVAQQIDPHLTVIGAIQ